jgi:cob(I)alamin adenosyltransferase
MKIYTRTGDDGTTGLLYGGRVRKDSPLPVAYGDVDEAQAAIGAARASVEQGSELDDLLVSVERDLWVLMAELATAPGNRDKLSPGSTLVTEPMVRRLEDLIDAYSERFEPPTEFVIPGGSVTSAHLDVARTVVRRAERAVLAAAPAESASLPYLNRLSDLLWTLARWQEGDSLAARSVAAPDTPNPGGTP